MTFYSPTWSLTLLIHLVQPTALASTSKQNISCDNILSWLLFFILTVPIASGQDWASFEAIKQYLERTGPAKIIQPPLSVKVISGESVLFYCQADGNPKPRLTFHWNDDELVQSKPGLQIKLVPPDAIALRVKLDRQTYNGDTIMCMARNQIGSDNASASITVYSANETPPEGFPKIRQDPSSTISQVGDSTHLQCDVGGADPPASIYWIKDQFHLVPTAEPRFRIVGSGSLVIETLMETDSGTYECMARNDVGTVISNSGHLHVRRIQFPPTISAMPTSVEVGPGQGTNLTCRAGGFPTPLVWWSTLGSPSGPSPSGSPVILTERALTQPQAHEATLRLTDITESSTYNCVAKNGLGLVRYNVSVVVQELPESPTGLDARPIEATFAVLHWQPSSSPNVDSYTLTYEEEEDSRDGASKFLHPPQRRRQIANIYDVGISSTNNPSRLISHNLTQLQPYTKYTVSVQAVNRASGRSVPSEVKQFRTAELPPSTPPRDLQATVASETSIYISWRPPLEANGRINGYKIFHSMREDYPLTSWLVTRTSEEQYKLEELIANATYFIKVKAFNTAGDGPTSEAFPIVVTPGDESETQIKALPSVPRDFHGSAVDANNIRLEWTKPDLPRGGIDRDLIDYRLTYRPSEVSSSTGTTTAQTRYLKPHLTDYVLDKLEPSTLYYINLAGRTLNGYGVAAQIQVTTDDQLPDVPRGRNINVLGSTTVQVSWHGPLQRLSDVHHYQLSWVDLDASGHRETLASREQQQRKIPVNREASRNPEYLYTATISNLKPATLYRMSVAAANPRGVGKSFDYVPVKTKDQGPPTPTNLQLVAIHKLPRLADHNKIYGNLPYLSVELSWQPSIQPLTPSHQPIYQVFATLVGPPDVIDEVRRQESRDGVVGLDLNKLHQGLERGRTTSPLLARRLLANVTGNTFRSTEADNIGYGLTYQFEVAIANYTSTDLTAKRNVTTVEAAPSASPQQVRVSSLGNTIEVKWSPPPIMYRNGKIISYEVKYFQMQSEPEPQSSIHATVPGQTKYLAENLRQKTYYTFTVRARTSIDAGPWSAPINSRTNIEGPPAPINVKAVRINAHQIKVTWDMPSQPSSADLLGFRIRYTPVEQTGPSPSSQSSQHDDKWTMFDVGPHQMAIISELDQWSKYVVCVQSQSLAGDYSQCSRSVIGQRTDDDFDPDYAVSHVFCVGDLDTIDISWQRPKKTERLTSFEITVGGVRRYVDDFGIPQTVEVQPRQTNRSLDSQHVSYSHKVTGLEANFIYSVHVRAVYGRTMQLEGAWQETECRTSTTSPLLVRPPFPVAVLEDQRQVVLFVSRTGEEMGKIRKYFLIVAPVHLTNIKPDQVNISDLINSMRGRLSSETRYLAGSYDQSLFDPPPRHARNFSLGSPASSPSVNHMPGERSGRRIYRRSFDDHLSYNSHYIEMDNKPLVFGQEYKAFIRACIIADDRSTNNPASCTSSDWSIGFGPDRQVESFDQLIQPYYSHGLPSIDGLHWHDLASLKGSGLFGLNSTGDIFIIVSVAAIVGLAVVAVICISLGCFMRRRRRPKLIERLTANPDSSGMKQPLMRPNNEYPATGGLQPSLGNGYDMSASAIHQSSKLGLSPMSDVQSASLLNGGGNNLLLTSMTSNAGVGGGSCRVSDLSARVQASPLVIDPMRRGVRQMGSAASYHTGSGQHSATPSHPSSLATGPASALGSNLGAYPPTVNGGSELNGGCVDENGMFAFPSDSLTGGGVGGGSSIGDFSRPSYDNQGCALRYPIQLDYFADHIARLQAADNLLFSQEYESIETDQAFTWDAAQLEENKIKNRYANVVAYDRSRVTLQPIDGVEGSDYINANYIDGYKRPNAYIATQGPMPETFSDFWRMIWEQRVSLIVMMTRLEERSRVKCDQYWPSRGPESYAGGLLTVTPVDSSELAYYTLRTFNLTARGIDDECRQVRQFQFTAWPDHGLPESPIALLSFVRRIRSAWSLLLGQGQTDPGPIVVHCSAGVGRTGAYIVIDIMLERMRYESTIDVYGCVKDIRTQRNFMVQTEEQYAFIHTALLDAIETGNTEVPARSLPTHVQKLRAIDPMSGGSSGLELEFKKLTHFRLAKAKHTSAQYACNKAKNRIASLLPYENNRVQLQSIRGVDGSDYINASFIDGYRTRHAYIACQGPTAKTVEDFWRMVWETNSNIVVMLTKLCERGRECCYPYWPADRSARYHYYVVDPMVEYNMPSSTLREFKLTDARDGQSRTLRQFQFTGWPDDGIQQVPATCDAFIEFLAQVHKTKQQFGQEGPITVHCSAGVGRTGIFIALSILFERMRYEGVVDLFQTARLLRTQRPGMIQTIDQYNFCYTAALEYLTSFDHYST